MSAIVPAERKGNPMIITLPDNDLARPVGTVRVTLSNYYDVAAVKHFSDMVQAEQYAQRNLGREWGMNQTVAIAIFDVVGPDGLFSFVTEMEW